MAVGRAIVREPKVFLFDEPLSNLDAKLRVQTRADISKLHQQLQTTFIYVTHDQMEAMTMATRIAVMNKGVLQQIDTPQNLYDRPDNLFVAGFIGSPAMNFFPAKLRKDGGKPDRGWRLLHGESPARPDSDLYALRRQGRSSSASARKTSTTREFAPPGIVAQPVEAQGGRDRADGQ